MKRKLMIIGSICAVILALICTVIVIRSERKPEGTYYCEKADVQYTIYADGTLVYRDECSNQYIKGSEHSGTWKLKENYLTLKRVAASDSYFYRYNPLSDSFYGVLREEYAFIKIQ